MLPEIPLVYLISGIVAIPFVLILFGVLLQLAAKWAVKVDIPFGTAGITYVIALGISVLLLAGLFVPIYFLEVNAEHPVFFGLIGIFMFLGLSLSINLRHKMSLGKAMATSFVFYLLTALPVAGVTAAVIYLPSLPKLLPEPPAQDWSQWMGSKRDGVWSESGIVEKFPESGPKVLWRKPIGGGYGGPAVVGGKVYFLDRVLDAGQLDPENPATPTNATCQERLWCMDAKTGEKIFVKAYPTQYSITYPNGPRTVPTVDGGNVYTLGAMGDLRCCDAATGQLVWKKNFVADYKATVPAWGFACNPLIYGNLIICTVGSEAVVRAMDKTTGRDVWKSPGISTTDLGYSSPIITTIHGRETLVVWHSEALIGLDPKTGRTYWSYQWKIHQSQTYMTPRLIGDKIFLSSLYDGARLIEIEGKPTAMLWQAKTVWRSDKISREPFTTDKLHCGMSTPIVKDDHIYGVCAMGELRCLKAADGSRVWVDTTATGIGEKPTRWALAYLTQQGDREVLFNEKGELILAKLSPQGYEEISRANILAPTTLVSSKAGTRKTVWTPPAFSGKCVFVRNDQEIVCVALGEAKK
jgi:outer membrane protein assembly factor BamB